MPVLSFSLEMVADTFSGYPQPLVASIIIFGTTVLISAIAFKLVDEAYKLGGFLHVILSNLSRHAPQGEY